MSETSLVLRQNLTINDWQMISGVAKAAYESRKFGVNEGEAAIKMLFCFENGLPLTAANTGLYIVNGRIAAQSNIIASQIRRHPDYEYRIDELSDKGCKITIMRRENGKWADVGTTEFSEADAKQANLLTKSTYQEYPRNLYFGRAITNAFRWFAPDVFSQPVYTPEELGGETVDGESWVLPSSDTQYQDQQTAQQQPAPVNAVPVPILDDLLKQYSPEQIMAANGGRIPGSVEEIQAVVEALKS